MGSRRRLPGPFRWARELVERRMPPRAWRDDHAPWGDAAFSENFARTASLGPMRARREAAYLGRWVRRGAKAIDLGCGAGRTALALARRGVEVLGVDIGEGALALARRVVGDLPCRFRVGDLGKDDYPEGPFALAYSIDGTLAGFPRRRAEAVLRRLRRAMEDGGHLVLELPAPAMAEALDLRQDWYVDQDSLAGAFPQLVLTEDFYLQSSRAYVHRIFCLDLRSHELHRYCQTYAIYEQAEIRELLARTGLEVVEVRGEFGPDAYAPDESQRQIVVARKS